jgi:hypothetical protein
MMSFIYKITNNVNKKVYIGKTDINVDYRYKLHLEDSKRQRYKNRLLYKAMAKYGVENFSVETLEETCQPDEREIYYIDKYNSFKDGYNATLGGGGKCLNNYSRVAELYNSGLKLYEIAELLNMCVDSVSYGLRLHNVKTDYPRYVRKSVVQKDKNETTLNSFVSMIDAAQYLIDNSLTNCKLTTARSHISEVVRGKRKSFAGFIWE